MTLKEVERLLERKEENEFTLSLYHYTFNNVIIDYQLLSFVIIYYHGNKFFFCSLFYLSDVVF